MRYHRQDLGLLWPHSTRSFLRKIPRLGTRERSVYHQSFFLLPKQLLPKLGKKVTDVDRSGKIRDGSGEDPVGRATEEGKHKHLCLWIASPVGTGL